MNYWKANLFCPQGRHPLGRHGCGGGYGGALWAYSLPNGWRFLLLNKVEFQQNYSSDEFGFEKKHTPNYECQVVFVGLMSVKIPNGTMVFWINTLTQNCRCFMFCVLLLWQVHDCIRPHDGVVVIR